MNEQERLSNKTLLALDKLHDSVVTLQNLSLDTLCNHSDDIKVITSTVDALILCVENEEENYE